MSLVLNVALTETAACYKHHWNFERCPPAVDLDELCQISSSVDHCITLLYGESSKAIELEEQGECRLVVVIVPKASGTDLILYYIYIYLGGRKLNNFLVWTKNLWTTKNQGYGQFEDNLGICHIVTCCLCSSKTAMYGGRIPPYLDVPLKPVCNWIDFEHVLSYH